MTRGSPRSGAGAAPAIVIAAAVVLAAGGPALGRGIDAPPSPAPGPAAEPAGGPPGADEAAHTGPGSRRTMRGYAANLAHNTAGVVMPGNYRNLAAGAVLAAAAYPYDDDVVAYFERAPHRDFGRIGQAMGSAVAVGAVTLGLFSAGQIAPWDRFRAATYDLSQAIVVDTAYVFALKAAVGRERPNRSNRASFPSGHASNAFTAATVFERHYGWKVGAPAYAVAGFIAVSRLAARKHYLSDITFGAALGIGVGRTVVRRNSRPVLPPPRGDAPPVRPPADRSPEVRLAPDPGPSGDGAGLRLEIVF